MSQLGYIVPESKYAFTIKVHVCFVIMIDIPRHYSKITIIIILLLWLFYEIGGLTLGDHVDVDNNYKILYRIFNNYNET